MCGVRDAVVGAGFVLVSIAYIARMESKRVALDCGNLVRSIKDQDDAKIAEIFNMFMISLPGQYSHPSDYHEIKNWSVEDCTNHYGYTLVPSTGYIGLIILVYTVASMYLNKHDNIDYDDIVSSY